MTEKPAIIIGGLILASGLASFFIWFIFFRMPGAEIKSGIELENQLIKPRLPISDIENSRGVPAPIFTQEPVLKMVAPLPLTAEIAPETAAERLKELEIPVFPLPRPKSEEIQKIPTPHAEDFLKRLQDAVGAAEKEIEERSVAAPTDVVSGASKQEISTTTEEINLPSLASEEFGFLYPDWFIESLKEAQNLLISYDPTYQPVAQIQTDADVRYIQEKIISSLFSAAMLTKEEAERYLTTIRFTLPQLQLIELENYRSEIKKTSQISPVRFLERMFSAAIRWPGFIVAFLDKALFPERVVVDPPKLFLVYGLIEKLKQIVVIPTSEAAGGAVPCGFCYSLPLCFQVGVPAPIGMNTWTAFCYCTGCLFGQGCLDRCTGLSAIWDPMTGICGCG